MPQSRALTAHTANNLANIFHKEENNGAACKHNKRETKQNKEQNENRRHQKRYTLSPLNTHKTFRWETKEKKYRAIHEQRSRRLFDRDGLGYFRGAPYDSDKTAAIPKTRKFGSSVRSGCASECAAISASAYSLAHMRISSCRGFVFAQHSVMLNRTTCMWA